MMCSGIGCTLKVSSCYIFGPLNVHRGVRADLRYFQDDKISSPIPLRISDITPDLEPFVRSANNVFRSPDQSLPILSVHCKGEIIKQIKIYKKLNTSQPCRPLQSLEHIAQQHILRCFVLRKSLKKFRV